MPFNFLTTLTTIMIVTTNPKTVIPDMIIQDQNPVCSRYVSLSVSRVYVKPACCCWDKKENYQTRNLGFFPQNHHLISFLYAGNSGDPNSGSLYAP